jgi:hypothetical protein
MSFSVELHIPCLPGEGAVFEVLGALEMELAQWTTTKGHGEFNGNEMSDTETVLYFDVSRPVKLLQEARRLLLEHGLADCAHALVSRKDCFNSEERTRVELIDLPEAEGGLRLPRRKTRRKALIGDYYAIPLADGRFAHAQYLAKEPGWGDFVQVVNLVTDNPTPLEQVRSAEPLFPPVGIHVPFGIAKGRWRFVGNEPVNEVHLPLYRESMSVGRQLGRAGVYEDWYIRNISDNEIYHVGRLNEEQRRLEFFVAWQPEEIAERILTGKNKYDQCR